MSFDLHDIKNVTIFSTILLGFPLLFVYQPNRKLQYVLMDFLLCSLIFFAFGWKIFESRVKFSHIYYALFFSGIITLPLILIQLWTEKVQLTNYNKILRETRAKANKRVRREAVPFPNF